MLQQLGCHLLGDHFIQCCDRDLLCDPNGLREAPTTRGKHLLSREFRIITQRSFVNWETLLEASLERGSVVHKLRILEMDNAVFAFFFEGSMKVGTLAISMTGLREGSTGTSSVLLGGKNLVASRALAEKVASMFNKMGIVSINTQLLEGEALRLYSGLLDKARRDAPADNESGSRG